MDMIKPIVSELPKGRADVSSRMKHRERRFATDHIEEPIARPTSRDPSCGATREELIATVGDRFADDLEAIQSAQGFIGLPNPSLQVESRQ